MKPVRVGDQKGYLVGGTLYRTKKDLTAAVRSILRAYEPGSRVSPEHFGFLLSLLSHHREVDRKMEGGIQAFEVRPVPGFERVSAFWIIRDDGSAVAWSTTELISPPSPFARFRKVCRYAVDDDLREVKTAWLRDNASDGHFICPITGERVPAGSAHVDHVPPNTFAALIKRFVADRGIDLEAIELPSSPGEEIGRQFPTPEMEADWLSFHREHANLRVISATANLSHVKKKARL